ncbi:MAG: hypothetical protein P9M06_06090, partial [Candidatus Saelkia tenebricola]|nr:hypothetical protein [Candidatus Saelkia tenebricola]
PEVTMQPNPQEPVVQAEPEVTMQPNPQEPVVQAEPEVTMQPNTQEPMVAIEETEQFENAKPVTVTKSTIMQIEDEKHIVTEDSIQTTEKTLLMQIESDQSIPYADSFKFPAYKWGEHFNSITRKLVTQNISYKITTDKIPLLSYPDEILGKKCNVYVAFTPDEKKYCWTQVLWSDNAIKENLLLYLSKEYSVPDEIKGSGEKESYSWKNVKDDNTPKILNIDIFNNSDNKLTLIYYSDQTPKEFIEQ